MIQRNTMSTQENLDISTLRKYIIIYYIFNIPTDWIQSNHCFYVCLTRCIYESCILNFGFVRFFRLKIRDLLLLHYYFTIENTEIVHVNCLYPITLFVMYYIDKSQFFNGVISIKVCYQYFIRYNYIPVSRILFSLIFLG